MASAGPLDNLRSRFSGGDSNYSGPIGRLSGTIFQGGGAPDNPYQRPAFAENAGQRIRIFSGDGSFFNRYYDNNGRALGYNFRDRSGLGLRETADNWVDRVRNRRRWGSDDGPTRRIGDGSFAEALGGAGRMLSGVATGLAAGSTATTRASGNYSSLLNSLQRAQSQYNRSFPVNSALQGRTTQLMRMGGR
jgi:hypothetical protein